MKLIPGNAQDIGRRKEQQDSFGFSDLGDTEFVKRSGFLGVVCDGMGGLAGGREASKLAVSGFLNAYMEKTLAESIPDALLRSLAAANQAVVSLARREGLDGRTGSTLVAVAIQNGRMFWISVGDSRIYLIRGANVLCANQDHAYRQRLLGLVAEGSASRSEVNQHPEGGHLTSFLGQPEIGEIDRSLRGLQLEPGDVVAGCTDGLYRAASQESFVEAFRKGPQEGCDSLVARALSKGNPKQDNLTVIAIGCEGESAVLPVPRRLMKAWPAVTLAAQLLLVLLLGFWGAKRFGIALSAADGKKVVEQEAPKTDAPGKKQAAPSGAPVATGTTDAEAALEPTRSKPAAPGTATGGGAGMGKAGTASAPALAGSSATAPNEATTPDEAEPPDKAGRPIVARPESIVEEAEPRATPDPAKNPPPGAADSKETAPIREATSPPLTPTPPPPPGPKPDEAPGGRAGDGGPPPDAAAARAERDPARAMDDPETHNADEKVDPK